MKRKTKTQTVRFIKIILVMLITVSLVSNAHFFAIPLEFMGSALGRLSAFFVFPHGISSSIATSYTEPIQEKSTEIKTQNSSTKAQSTTSKAQNTTNKVVSANSNAMGRILSQTITKAGANLSYGDVYIRSKTGVDISIEKALKAKINLKIKMNSSLPQVLLVHTHATETFFPKLQETYPSTWAERDKDTNKNMIAVGKVLKDELNINGIKTVQSTVLHDIQDYEGSYDRSRATIKKYLKKYPSIKVVLDVHRDAINEDDGDRIRPIIDIKNKTAGQIMLIAGCECGSITDYPTWQQNLRFGVKLQQALEQTYPNFARPLFFAEKKYNQDLCVNSLLVEVGSQANLIEEAKYSAKLFANVLSEFLKGYS